MKNSPNGVTSMDKKTRNKLLALIHAQKKKACLSDSDYRAILREVVGVESSADCTPQQLKKLADHFKTFDRKPPKNQGDDYYHIIEGTQNWRQKRHIAAMWVELGYRAGDLDLRAQKQFNAADFTGLGAADLHTLGRDLAKRRRRKQG